MQVRCVAGEALCRTRLAAAWRPAGGSMQEVQGLGPLKLRSGATIEILHRNDSCVRRYWQAGLAARQWQAHLPESAL